jgi:hypothetical protein
MTPKDRLDRLERMAMLLAGAGFRARSQLRARDREHDQKIDHLVDLQIKNEEKFAQNEERFAKLAEKTDQRFRELAESQARTDRNLAELIKIVRSGRNGTPPPDS